MSQATKRAAAHRARLTVEALECRTVPATIAYATGAGAGGGPQVNVYDGTGTLLTAFNAYPGFSGGVGVAPAYVGKGGWLDVIAGAGPGGGPHVQVFSGADLLLGRATAIRSFLAYDGAFRGGVFVAGGDINFDGITDIVTGAGPG